MVWRLFSFWEVISLGATLVFKEGLATATVFCPSQCEETTVVKNRKFKLLSTKNVNKFEETTMFCQFFLDKLIKIAVPPLLYHHFSYEIRRNTPQKNGKPGQLLLLDIPFRSPLCAPLVLRRPAERWAAWIPMKMACIYMCHGQGCRVLLGMGNLPPLYNRESL